MMQNAAYRPKRQILSLIVIATLTLALLAILYLTRYLILISLIGIGFGVLLAPVMNLMQEHFRVPRALSALTMVILILGGTAGLIYGLVELVSDQAQLFISRAPDLISSIQSQVDRWLDRYPWIEEQVRRLNLAATMRTTLATLFQGVQTSLAVLAGFVLILTISVYTAINSRSYFHGVLALFPAYLRPKAGVVLHHSATVLRQWFKSQLTVMAISGGGTTLGLWILGIDYWLLLGLATAILGFIPYIGAFLTVIAAALVTLGSEPNKIWWVLGIYFAVQQLEGNVTMPLVMRGGVQLPEVHLIFLMLIMGSLFGIPGVFTAPPLLAVGRSIFLMTYVDQMNRRIHSTEVGVISSKKHERREHKSA